MQEWGWVRDYSKIEPVYYENSPLEELHNHQPMVMYLIVLQFLHSSFVGVCV